GAPSERDAVTTMRRQGGFTLVELMIGLVISGIVVTAAINVGFTVRNQYRDHREISGVEQAARVSLDLLTDAVRGAGAGVRTGWISDGSSTCKAALAVTMNASGVSYGDLTVVPGTDMLEVIRPVGGVFTTLTSAFDGSSSALAVVSGDSFSEGDYALVVNLDQWAALVRISGAPGAPPLPAGPLAVGGCSAAPTSYAAGSLVLRARAERYFVATSDSDDTATPALYLDLDSDDTNYAPEPLAPGIEDLQLVVAQDTNDDGYTPEVGLRADDDEWYGN